MLFLSFFSSCLPWGAKGGGTRPEGEVEGGEVGRYRGKKGPAFSGEFSGLLLS